MSAILNRWCCRIFILTFAVCLFPRLSLAAEGLDSGDTAWVIVSSTLVLMMTLPGLLLFYAGLVRSVNVISTSIHCYAIACLASVLWFAVGHSLAFGDGGQANAWIGGLEKVFLAGVGADALVGTIPESVFFTFQMTFIIITLGLIAGAYAERIKFAHVMLFSGLWGDSSLRAGDPLDMGRRFSGNARRARFRGWACRSYHGRRFGDRDRLDAG